MILGIGAAGGILSQAGPHLLLDLDEGSHIDAVGIVDPAGGVRAGDRLCTQLPCLLDGIGGNVASAGNGDGLALEDISMSVQNFTEVDVIDAIMEFVREEKAAGRPLTKELDGRVIVRR